MDILRRFREHPQSVGESYSEHARHAAHFGGLMLRGGFACLVHAIFPSLCVKSGSQIIIRLHDRMVVNRKRHRPYETSIADNLDSLAEHI